MIKLLIFDLDGTLVDTLPSIHHAMQLAMGHYGVREPTPEETAAALGSGARQLLARLIPEEYANNEDKLDEILDYYSKMYDSTYLEADHCYDGMKESVVELKKRGYTIAVLSNKVDHCVVNMVNQLFEKGIVSLARGQTELPTKPDPTVPLMMARELGFDSAEIAFIGDSDVDVQTAKNAGMMSVACSWGYRPRDILKKLSPDVIIDKPTELLDVFK